MEEMRNRIEKMFGQTTGWIYDNRLKALFGLFLFVAVILSNLPKLTIDTSTEGFLHADDPALVDYYDFRQQFGRDEMILVAIKPPDLFNVKFLQKLKSLHNEFENNVPYLDDITSMVNARNTLGKESELIVEDLLENFPETEEDLKSLRKKVMSNPFYKNLLVSEDGAFTTIVIKTHGFADETESTEDALEGFEEEESPGPPPKGDRSRPSLTDTQNNAVVDAVREIAKKYDTADFMITIAGSPVVTRTLKASMMSDMRKFMVMAILIISLLLFITFRRVSAVVFSLAIVILSVLSTIGLMAAFGVPIKLPTQIIPSFLMAVCVGDAVHILAIFYYRIENGENKRDAIIWTVEHSGIAILMTSVTTAAGLGSFSTAEVAPIADLGMFAAFGVMLGFIYTVVLLPALISLFPVEKGTKDHHRERSSTLDRLLIGVADISTTYAKSVVAIFLVILVIAGAFASTVYFSHNPLVWFPEDSEIRIATERIDKNMKGSTTLEVIIDTGKENGLYDPAILKKIDGLAVELTGAQIGKVLVGKTIAITDILKETNRALNENRPEYYKTPDNRKLIAQEFLLFENSGSDDMEDFSDSQFTKARFTIKTGWLDAIVYGKFMTHIESRFREVFGQEAKISATGLIALLGRTLSAAIHSAAKSYVIAGFVITVMMMLLVGSVRMGAIAMIPNFFPIIFIIGIMGLKGTPLDMFTMLIGSIAIGMAVDDTVHFMHNFRKYFAKTGNVATAVRETLLTTGRAMIVTTIVLSSGFFIFMFATMKNLFNFGLLTGITIICALLADFFLAPALMKLVYHKDD